MQLRKIVQLVAVAGMALASTASANTTMPGVSCTLQPVPNQGVMSAFNGTIMNTDSVNSLKVTCPIPGGLVPSGGVNGAYGAFNRAGQPISCQLIAETPNNQGFTMSVSPNAITNTNITSFQRPTFARINSGTYYYANCTIPARTAQGVSHLTHIETDF